MKWIMNSSFKRMYKPIVLKVGEFTQIKPSSTKGKIKIRLDFGTLVTCLTLLLWCSYQMRTCEETVEYEHQFKLHFVLPCSLSKEKALHLGVPVLVCIVTPNNLHYRSHVSGRFQIIWCLQSSSDIVLMCTNKRS